MEKYLQYNHPAVAPMGILIDKGYTLEELQQRFTLDEIKCFFIPVNFKWEDEKQISEIKK